MSRRLLPPMLAVATLALGGCISIFPKTPPVQLYRFEAAADSAAQTPADDAQRVSLVFPPVAFPRAATGDQLLTATGPEAAYVAGVRWASPAAVLFHESTEHAFATRSSRIRLLGRAEIASAQGFLRLDVTQFEASYPVAEAAPTVRVKLIATLTHRSGAFAAERSFSAEAAASENGARAIVDAYSRATERATAELIGWVDTNADQVADDVPLRAAGAGPVMFRGPRPGEAAAPPRAVTTPPARAAAPRP